MFIFTNRTVQNVPWNKGKLTGQKPPLLPAHFSTCVNLTLFEHPHVWAYKPIRTKLQDPGKTERVRELSRGE